MKVDGWKYPGAQVHALNNIHLPPLDTIIDDRAEKDIASAEGHLLDLET